MAARTGPLTIALAEDDLEMRKLMAFVLRKEGYVVLELKDGAALLEALLQARQSKQMPSLIVSDCRMPGADGLVVLKTIREWGWQMPFVLITAFGSEETVSQAVCLGASAVLSKPFPMEDFCTAVRCLVR